MTENGLRNYRHIIWDWNGTLLNDVNIVVEAMNTLLKKRSMPLLCMERYKEVITFPIRNYYERIGFDFSKEPFEELGVEYMEEFNSDKYCFKLFDGVVNTLDLISNAGIGQSILSAYKERELKAIVSELGIDRYFTRVAGLDNLYAFSKVERGRELMADLKLDPSEVLLIGDTDHDFEVSRELGCSCLLLCSGHQSRDRLTKCNVDVADDIACVYRYLSK